jgi:hypothetical protein
LWVAVSEGASGHRAAHHLHFRKGAKGGELEVLLKNSRSDSLYSLAQSRSQSATLAGEAPPNKTGFGLIYSVGHPGPKLEQAATILQPNVTKHGEIGKNRPVRIGRSMRETADKQGLLGTRTNREGQNVPHSKTGGRRFEPCHSCHDINNLACLAVLDCWLLLPFCYPTALVPRDPAVNPAIVSRDYAKMASEGRTAAVASKAQRSNKHPSTGRLADFA